LKPFKVSSRRITYKIPLRKIYTIMDWSFEKNQPLFVDIVLQTCTLPLTFQRAAWCNIKWTCRHKSLCQVEKALRVHQHARGWGWLHSQRAKICFENDDKSSPVILFGKDVYAGAPVFMPKPQARSEDEGYILTQLYNSNEHGSNVCILDVKTTMIWLTKYRALSSWSADVLSPSSSQYQEQQQGNVSHLFCIGNWIGWSFWILLEMVMEWLVGDGPCWRPCGWHGF
jgi:hypothetical protein